MKKLSEILHLKKETGPRAPFTGYTPKPDAGWVPIDEMPVYVQAILRGSQPR